MQLNLIKPKMSIVSDALYINNPTEGKYKGF